MYTVKVMIKRQVLGAGDGQLLIREGGWDGDNALDELVEWKGL